MNSLRSCGNAASAIIARVRRPRAAPATALLATVLAAAAAPAHTADAPFPTRPIRFVVPFPAGGSTDVISRVVTQKIAEAWSQQIVIDNRPGAASNLGTEIVARAAPDGYTLVMGSPGLASNPSLYRNTPFDPLRDFAPIVYVAIAPLVLVVHPSVPANTLQELIALARSRPGRLNYASAGSSTHLATELFRRAAGIDIVHVPYKGAAPATNDVVAGQVQMMVDNILSALPHIRSGRLRALAVTSARRAPSAPEIPAIAEQGFPGFEAASWFGMLAPAKTPPRIVERFNAETNRALATTDVRERFNALGVIPVGGTSQEFATFVAKEVDKWSRLIREAGIRTE